LGNTLKGSGEQCAQITIKKNSFTPLRWFTLAKIPFILGRSIHPVKKHWGTQEW